MFIAYGSKAYIKYTDRSEEFSNFVDWDLDILAYPELLDSAGYSRIYSPKQLAVIESKLKKMFE